MSSETLWIRCGTAEHQEIAVDLQDRLQADDDPLAVLITGPTLRLSNPQSDRDAAIFLERHRPNAMLWMGGAIDLATLGKCLDHTMPLGLADMDVMQLEPMQKRQLFRRNKFHKISFATVRSKSAISHLAKSGVGQSNIEHAKELRPDLHILSSDEDTRHAFVTKLGTRPTWLAAGARLRDVEMLTKAHKRASRASHRAMLIVVGSDSDEELAKSFSSNGLHVAQQRLNEELTDEAQVFIASSMDELGLFFRVATMAFICGTFDKGAEVDPFGAAALGCAIITGPKFQPYASKFERLQNEGALLPIAATDHLGDAVIDLLSVEKTANLANAGWQVSTQGIEVLDRLEQLTREHLLTLVS